MNIDLPKQDDDIDIKFSNVRQYDDVDGKKFVRLAVRFRVLPHEDYMSVEWSTVADGSQDFVIDHVLRFAESLDSETFRKAYRPMTGVK